MPCDAPLPVFTLVKREGTDDAAHGEPITGEYIHLCFKTDRRQYPIIVAFNMLAERVGAMPPPAFAVVPNDHPMISRAGTHTVFCHEEGNWSLCRPLELVWNKCVYSLRAKDTWVLQNLQTLMSHCYLCDIINDEELLTWEAAIAKIEKVVALAADGSMEHESDAAWSKASQLVGNLKKYIA